VSELESVKLGTVEDEDGFEVEVHREADGAVVLWAPAISYHERFTPAARDKLRELLDRAAMPGQPASCAYCEDDPDHPDPDNAGTCTCRSPGCGRGWCPQRDALAELDEGQTADRG
jgi:hypothetical protein